MALPGAPKFNSVEIFASTKSDASKYYEGNCYLLEYEAIRQRIHFNGEEGDRYLTHGYPDRKWVYRGRMSAKDLNTLYTQLYTILQYVRNSQDDPVANYYTLIDSFGNTYTSSAQIHHCTYSPPHICSDGHYTCDINVEGIVTGMPF